ncbi:MAG: glutaredoxin domain-containing protein [Patescibacteria group bacterium]
MSKITLYTTRTCPFCKIQKDYFQEKNVQYLEILVDENPEEAQKMIEISGQMGVPFTVIDRDDGQRVTILGFDRPRIDEALGIASTSSLNS